MKDNRKDPVRIVTSFIAFDGRYLILRRSSHVRSMPGIWSAVSGIIEGGEEPLARAKTEIMEELGICPDALDLQARTGPMYITSPRHRDAVWEVHPFLFSVKTPDIRLNWENAEFRWVRPDEIMQYQTVPSLYRVLLGLI